MSSRIIVQLFLLPLHYADEKESPDGIIKSTRVTIQREIEHKKLKKK